MGGTVSLKRFSHDASLKIKTFYRIFAFGIIIPESDHISKNVQGEQGYCEWLLLGR